MRCCTFTYRVGEKDYNVHVTNRSRRNITYRFKSDGFHVSAPLFASQKDVFRGLDKFAARLINNYNLSNKNYSFEEDYIYLLGKKESLSGLGIENSDELDAFLKGYAITTLTNLVRKYEQIMGIKTPYKVGVRKTTTRFGSNSSLTHSLSFQLALVHYSEDIISTVVVHELAHEFHRNHKQKFYDCVNLYCPNYKVLQKKLKRGIHE